MPSDYVDSKSLVPIIRKCDFDDKAAEFLTKYYPQALDKPMAVPICEIAQKKIGLRVFKDYRLTEDFSILGQMCFTNGYIPIYDKEEDEFRDMKVRYGTMFIDPDTYFMRNLGSVNNTIAHECVHWEDHRSYYLALPITDSVAIACRCPTTEKSEETQPSWTDIDWMEWQANGIAPRILMPIQNFGKVVEDIKKRYSTRTDNRVEDIKMIARHVARFYNVSMQSAAIRMSELDIRV